MNTRRQPPVVAVTLGDPSGIGPEVVVRALSSPRVRRALRPLVFGDRGVVDRAIRATKARPLGEGELVEVTWLRASDARPGRPSVAGARAQVAFLEAAIAAAHGGRAQALCTAPISKAQARRGGLQHPGHTELLAERFGADRVAMMMAGPKLRVVLATLHLPLSEVPGRIDRRGLVGTILLARDELRRLFGIKEPRLAVCGLNPHAGEGGAFGDEEIRVIAPAIEEARRRGALVEGPFAADGLFGRHAESYDAVVAMYHDQGLVPVKIMYPNDAVNVTLGLPIPRTSPDHGVAYDLAGTGRANPSSMEAALLLAARMTRAS